MTYTITTVDWNEEQTERWLKFVNKNCPTANVVLVPDTKPIHWSWSAGKLNCFNQLHKAPDRIIYMDTDTLVFEDMEYIFEVMDGNVGAPLFHWYLNGCKKNGPQFAKSKEIEIRVGAKPNSFMHWNTGMIILNGYDPFRLYANWMLAFRFHEVTSTRWRQSEETAFSVAMLMDPDIKMYEIPMEFHGNVLGSKVQFGDAKKPTSVHYHKTERLKRRGLKGWLEDA